MITRCNYFTWNINQHAPVLSYEYQWFLAKFKLLLILIASYENLSYQ